MRRQGQYGDPSANTYVATQMQHIADEWMEMHSKFEAQLEAFTPERENPFVDSKPNDQWRWETDGSNLSNSMASRQGGDAPRSYFQDQRPGFKLAMQSQSQNARSETHKEDKDFVYEVNNLAQTFEGLEQKFRDDIMKLAKEQNDAEDAENARHREKMNAINAQYEEKLVALRARHASGRIEFLKRESQARHHQFLQNIRDLQPASAMPPNDPHGYNPAIPAIPSAAIGEVQHGFAAAGHFDPNSERARFLGRGARVQNIEPSGAYPGGRVYDTTGSRRYN